MAKKAHGAATSGSGSVLDNASEAVKAAGAEASGEDGADGDVGENGKQAASGSGSALASSLREFEVDPNSEMAKALLANSKVNKAENATFGPVYKDKFTTPEREAQNAAQRLKRGKKPKVKVIQKGHEQYALAYGMMLGIRVSVGRSEGYRGGERKRLSLQDFAHIDHYEFFPEGSKTTPPHKLAHAFKFKDYAPRVFRRLRERFGIKTENYLLSLTGNYSFIEFLSNSKSGQFFFFSHDRQFLIKTQSYDESKFLRRIFPHYTEYMLQNPNSLINRYYGMHRVKMKHLRRRIHFVIMGNCTSTPVGRRLDTQYDLKGATYSGRYVTEQKRKKTLEKRGEDSVLKDLNLIENGQKIRLGAEKRATFLKQIQQGELLKPILRFSCHCVRDSRCLGPSEALTQANTLNRLQISGVAQDYGLQPLAGRVRCSRTQRSRRCIATVNRELWWCKVPVEPRAH